MPMVSDKKPSFGECCVKRVNGIQTTRANLIAHCRGCINRCSVYRATVHGWGLLKPEPLMDSFSP